MGFHERGVTLDTIDLSIVDIIQILIFGCAQGKSTLVCCALQYLSCLWIELGDPSVGFDTCKA